MNTTNFEDIHSSEVMQTAVFEQLHNIAQKQKRSSAIMTEKTVLKYPHNHAWVKVHLYRYSLGNNSTPPLNTHKKSVLP